MLPDDDKCICRHLTVSESFLELFALNLRNVWFKMKKLLFHLTSSFLSAYVGGIWLCLWHYSVVGWAIKILIGQVAADWPVKMSIGYSTMLSRQRRKHMILTLIFSSHHFSELPRANSKVLRRILICNSQCLSTICMKYKKRPGCLCKETIYGLQVCLFSLQRKEL